MAKSSCGKEGSICSAWHLNMYFAMTASIQLDLPYCSTNTSPLNCCIACFFIFLWGSVRCVFSSKALPKDPVWRSTHVSFCAFPVSLSYIIFDALNLSDSNMLYNFPAFCVYAFPLPPLDYKLPEARDWGLFGSWLCAQGKKSGT